MILFHIFIMNEPTRKTLAIRHQLPNRTSRTYVPACDMLVSQHFINRVKQCPKARKSPATRLRGSDAPHIYRRSIVFVIWARFNPGDPCGADPGRGAPPRKR